MSADVLKARKSILIVDDEPDVRMILEAILTPAGYSVTEARDGQEALDILADRKFDLMFLDLAMPRVSGEEVMKQLRSQERLKDMPVIMLTAKAQKKDVEKGYEEGASFYIVKPFSNTTIRELTRYLLDEDLTEEQKERILLKLLSKPAML
jgi:CheY-like chemotaxis protein